MIKRRIERAIDKFADWFDLNLQWIHILKRSTGHVPLKPPSDNLMKTTTDQGTSLINRTQTKIQ